MITARILSFQNSFMTTARILSFLTFIALSINCSELLPFCLLIHLFVNGFRRLKPASTCPSIFIPIGSVLTVTVQQRLSLCSHVNRPAPASANRVPCIQTLTTNHEERKRSFQRAVKLSPFRVGSFENVSLPLNDIHIHGLFNVRPRSRLRR